MPNIIEEGLRYKSQYDGAQASAEAPPASALGLSERAAELLAEANRSLKNVDARIARNEREREELLFEAARIRDLIDRLEIGPESADSPLRIHYSDAIGVAEARSIANYKNNTEVRRG